MMSGKHHLANNNKMMAPLAKLTKKAIMTDGLSTSQKSLCVGMARVKQDLLSGKFIVGVFKLLV